MACVESLGSLRPPALLSLMLDRKLEDAICFLLSITEVLLDGWMSRAEESRLGGIPLREMVEPRMELASDDGSADVLLIVMADEAIPFWSRTGLKSDIVF